MELIDETKASPKVSDALIMVKYKWYGKWYKWWFYDNIPSIQSFISLLLL